MIGLFAVSEVLRTVAARRPALGGRADPRRQPLPRLGRAWSRSYWRQQIRGNVLGTLIGVLPGAGADIAAWVATRQPEFSQTPEKYGTGHLEGIVESTSANNSALPAPGCRRWSSASRATPSPPS